MTWMNEHEVEEALILYTAEVDTVPNLCAGARVLAALVDWTNSNSDGWPYWNKPSKASDTLQRHLHENLYAARFGTYQGTADPLRDVDTAEMNRAIQPVKAFLTRQGVSYDTDLPWVAILPVTA